MTFHAWLLAQARRDDDVGALARHAAKDRAFPRDASKLVVFLARYEGMPLQREAVKAAHKEWRLRGRSA